MVWTPTVPATNADLLSAPIRDNFAALDTTLMAALTSLANGQVLTKATGPVIAGVAAGANGQVLTLVAGAPSWSALPTTMILTGLTLSGMTAGSVLFAGPSGVVSQDNANLFWDDATNNLRLFGATVGTSGVGVLALGSGTAPTTSPANAVALYSLDLAGTDGTAACHVQDEAGGVTRIGTHGALSGLRLTAPSGTMNGLFLANAAGEVGINGSPISGISVTAWAGLGMVRHALRALSGTSATGGTIFSVADSVSNVQCKVTDETFAPVYIRASPPGGPDLGLRQVFTGATDSGGAGYRLLRVQN